jgi:hypothetical protein
VNQQNELRLFPAPSLESIGAAGAAPRAITEPAGAPALPLGPDGGSPRHEPGASAPPRGPGLPMDPAADTAPHSAPAEVTRFVPEAEPRGAPAPAQSTPDALNRIEQTLIEIRARLDRVAREKEYREFSPSRFFGWMAQTCVVGFAGAALSDWFFDFDAARILVKLAFAAVLQLAALTAFTFSRGDSG